MESSNNKQINLEENKDKLSELKDLKTVDKSSDNSERENTPDIIEIDTNPESSNKGDRKSQETDKDTTNDQRTPDLTKEDDLYIIPNKDGKEQLNENRSSERESIESIEREEPYCFEDDICFINSDTDVQSKLLVLPDSDSEIENYLKEIKPKIECESFPVQETLHLTFEETFFLLYGLGCLNLIDFDGNLLDIDSAWHFFCKADKNFVQKYVVYHYFRSKGWVVKPGLKYGGDFC